MKYISHRGNINGPDTSTENNPSQIDFVISSGFDCEIDLHIENGTPFLGHDHPQYQISLEWLKARSEYLWIHCKNYESLMTLSNYTPSNSFNFFYHDSDFYTLTSKLYVWTHPMAVHVDGSKMVLAIPEKKFSTLSEFKTFYAGNSFAYCSDYADLSCFYNPN